MILKGEFSDERYVALLAEGVDRNSLRTGKGEVGKVALLAEGVDRNVTPLSRRCTPSPRSPSSRRAWIEMDCQKGA